MLYIDSKFLIVEYIIADIKNMNNYNIYIWLPLEFLLEKTYIRF